MNFVEKKKRLFAVKTFTDYSLVLPKDATLPNFAEKTFTNSHKTSKFVKVFFFSYRSFLLYNIRQRQSLEVRSGSLA